MEIKTLKLKDINPAPYNPRKDLQPDDPEYVKLKKAIDEFGLVDPLVVNKRGNVLISGHQRHKILLARGDTETQVSIVDLPPQKEKALNLALNKISGEWDNIKLKDILEELDTGDFDMEITGFDLQEIEDLMTQVFMPALVDYSDQDDDRGNRTAPGKGAMVVSIGTLSAVVEYETVRSMMGKIQEKWGEEDDDYAISQFCHWFLNS